MGYGIKIDVKGDYALFTRCEMKVERYSYDVITPSAARGLLEAVYWKPAIKYVIDRIVVYNEPQFANIRRNEVSVKILESDCRKLMSASGGAKGYINTSESIQQRAATVLKNVHYAIEAHFEMTVSAGEHDTPEKHYNIILRRLRNGQCFHQPYLGTREFPAIVNIIEGETPKSSLTGERDMGFMLYDMDFTDYDNIIPMFFRAKMNDGIIDVKNAEIVR